jgi:predicted transcriptional regulator
MSERKTFTVRIQPDLMKALKMLSVERESNVSDILEFAILDYLKKEGKEGKKLSRK